MSTSPVIRYAETELPTRLGPFRVVVYREGAVEHLAIVRGEVEGGEPVLARVHSECFTGEVLHSLKCDCAAQLDTALERIADVGRGVVVYLRQEGRGIGLGDKIRAYALQAKGRDTLDANLDLGLPADARTYGAAAAILEDLGVREVVLLTNNPLKITALQALGVRVAERLPLWVDEQAQNRNYLAVKRARMGHLGDIAPIVAAGGAKR